MPHTSLGLRATWLKILSTSPVRWVKGGIGVERGGERGEGEGEGERAERGEGKGREGEG